MALFVPLAIRVTGTMPTAVGVRTRARSRGSSGVPHGSAGVPGPVPIRPAAGAGPDVLDGAGRAAPWGSAGAAGVDPARRSACGASGDRLLRPGRLRRPVLIGKAEIDDAAAIGRSGPDRGDDGDGGGTFDQRRCP